MGCSRYLMKHRRAPRVHRHYSALAPQTATATNHNSSSSSIEHSNYRTQQQLQQRATTTAIATTATAALVLHLQQQQSIQWHGTAETNDPGLASGSAAPDCVMMMMMMMPLMMMMKFWFHLDRQNRPRTNAAWHESINRWSRWTLPFHFPASARISTNISVFKPRACLGTHTYTHPHTGWKGGGGDAVIR